jgi:DNA (cytosine-5)-methyltransferase 1
LQPRVFVAENVAGLVRGTAIGYFKQISRELEQQGYAVTCSVLDAQWLGVPQTRSRAIFIGVRRDLGKRAIFPKPLPYRYTLREAFENLVQSSTEEASIEGYAIEKEWRRLKRGQASEKYLNLIRCHEDSPACAITATHGSLSAASATHPSEPRKFTTAELRRICGFPDDFVLTGTFTQQSERLGRAVPPVMMSYIAAAVRDSILR